MAEIEYRTPVIPKITSDQIIKIVIHHGLKRNDTIDFDKTDKRRYVPPNT